MHSPCWNSTRQPSISMPTKWITLTVSTQPDPSVEKHLFSRINLSNQTAWVAHWTRISNTKHSTKPSLFLRHAADMASFDGCGSSIRHILSKYEHGCYLPLPQSFRVASSFRAESNAMLQSRQGLVGAWDICTSIFTLKSLLLHVLSIWHLQHRLRRDHTLTKSTAKQEQSGTNQNHHHP